MERQQFNAYFFAWLRGALPLALLLGICGGIFAGVFFLYGVPAEALAYAGALCLAAALPFFLWRFFRGWQRCRQLYRLTQLPPLEIGKLPTEGSPAEEIWQQLTEKLLEEIRARETRWQSWQQQSQDYYTAWVHQIKAPIATMGLILQGEDTPEHRELSNELFRIEQYAEMALCYLRLESPSSDLVLQTLPLDKIIRQAVRRYAAQFVRRRLRLEYAGCADQVLTDEKWLQFILEQLLSNAVKYTPAGGCVTIEVRQGQLFITDTGMGIAPEDLPRIFEKGFTGYNGRSDKKSTGLGLYLCRQAADMLGHRLWASSEPGQGATFTLDLRRPKLEVE